MTFWKSTSLPFFILLLAGITHVNAQADRFNIQRLAFHEKIDQKQRYLDVLDGKADQQVSFKDPIQTRKATKAYITLVDSIQSLIEERNTDGAISYNEVLYLYGILAKVSINNYHLTDYYLDLMENLSSILRHKDDDQLAVYLSRDIKSSIINISIYKDRPAAGPFMQKAAHLYPNDVLKELGSFVKEPYALSVIEEVGKVSPQALKKYFSSKNQVNTLVLDSKDPVIVQLVDLYNKYGNESKVYYFIDLIMNENLSADLMHSVSKYPQTYLNALIKAKQKSNAIGDYDLERELSVKALEEVRKVNDLHDLTDTSKRFEAVRNMGASELYTLIVYSPEEIFTSTFNGFFERLLTHMNLEGLNGYFLIEQANFNKFRTFIKLCAGYNALEKFLATMPEEMAKDLLKKFVSALNPDDGNLSEAVNVADTFGSLENIKYLKIFEEYLKEEFNDPQINKDTKTLYGLLLKLLYQKMGTAPDPALAAELDLYPLPAVESISIGELANASGTTQMHFFFDDEDGLTSYSTFIAAFKAAGYTIEEKTHYVIIRSKGKHATAIYANKPLSEREGQAELVQLVQEGLIQPSIIVHRGHSYYAMNTISQIPPYAKVVFLGSCGGYHNISEVIKRAPEVHIIASKQIGTYVVNNTLLVELSKTLKDQDQLAWAPLWKTLDSRLKGSGKGYERFLDYVPPHKNMGATFIQAYNRLAEQDVGN